MITAVPHTLPLTLAERNRISDGFRVEATFEEYLEFAEQCGFNVEYINGEIVPMSQASLPHEALVSRINYLLISLFDNQEDMEVFSSNIKIYIEATGDSLNADVTVVQGKPDYLRLPSGNLSTATVQNPILIVKVLSESTQAFDLGEKLELYKRISSLQQVLFVSQQQPWVSAYVRGVTPGVWLNTSAHALTETISVLNHTVLLAQVYKKIKFA